jgi:hypothetical protein
MLSLLAIQAGCAGSESTSIIGLQWQIDADFAARLLAVKIFFNS